MEKSSRRILIISYSLPPYPGIGGRRWAKFAKYLHRNNENLWLLSAKNTFAKKSEWTKDVDSIPAYHFTSLYPAELSLHPKSITEKIRYRIKRYQLSRNVAGNYYDRAAQDQQVVLAKAREIISKHEITHVIVSGAPFHLLHHALKIRDFAPAVKLIGDFRDPWTTDVSVSAMSSLPGERKAVEVKMEGEVARGYDMLITVANAMADHFRSIAPNQKIVSIPNGYDPEDIEEVSFPDCERVPGEIRIAFTGTIYNGVQHLFTAFCEALQHIEKSPGALRIRVDFAGDIPQQYVQQLSAFDHSKKVKAVFHGFVALEKIHQLIHCADYGLLMIAKGFEFSFSTKYLEYIMHNKPLIVLGDKGELAEYVEKHNIGFVFNAESVKNRLITLCEARETSPHFSKQDMDRDFNVQQLTLRLIHELNSLQ